MRTNPAELASRLHTALAAKPFNHAALAPLSRKLDAYIADPFAGLEMFLREYVALIESELRAAEGAIDPDLWLREAV